MSYSDHWSGKEAPRKKLQEDDHQCMIETRLPYAGTLEQNDTSIYDKMHVATIV